MIYRKTIVISAAKFVNLQGLALLICGLKLANYRKWDYIWTIDYAPLEYYKLLSLDRNNSTTLFKIANTI